MKRNPAKAEDILAYLEYFINEEKSGIKEYTKFLNRLPHSVMRSTIHQILKDERIHVQQLLAMKKYIGHNGDIV